MQGQYAPYQQPYQYRSYQPTYATPYQQPVHGFVYVTGMEGARAY